MPDIVARHVYAAPANAVAGQPLPCADCNAPREAEQHYRTVELSDTGKKWLAELQNIDRQLKAVKTTITDPLEAKRERAVENLQAEIGDAEAAIVGGRAVLLWVYAKPRDGIDIARLREELPGVFEKYFKPAKAARPFKAIGS